MGGEDAMPAPTDARADDAQYDNPLRGVLLHTDGPLAAGVPTADDEVIAAGARPGDPSTARGWPRGQPYRSGFLSIFCAVWLKRAFSRLPGRRLAPKASDSAGVPAALAGAGNLSPAFPSRTDGVRRRRATSDEGNAAR
jgi:hypothetical protein